MLALDRKKLTQHVVIEALGCFLVLQHLITYILNSSFSIVLTKQYSLQNKHSFKRYLLQHWIATMKLTIFWRNAGCVEFNACLLMVVVRKYSLNYLNKLRPKSDWNRRPFIYPLGQNSCFCSKVVTLIVIC